MLMSALPDNKEEMNEQKDRKILYRFLLMHRKQKVKGKQLRLWRKKLKP